MAEIDPLKEWVKACVAIVIFGSILSYIVIRVVWALTH